MTRVQAMQSTITGFTNALRRMAVKDKSFAQELVFKHGLRGEVTTEFAKKLGKGAFGANGRLTSEAKVKLTEDIKYFGLSKNATWDDLIAAEMGSIKTPILIKKFPTINLKKIGLNLDEVIKSSKLSIERILEDSKDRFAKFLKNYPKPGITKKA